MSAFKAIFYNLREGRSQMRVRLEVRVLLRYFKPKMLGGCEAVGYDLRPVKGYTLLRDRSTPSRANVFAYVHRAPSRVRWHDMATTWRATEHEGRHDPRSYLEFTVDGVRFLVVHQPPDTRFGDTGPAKEEGAALIVSRMHPRSGRPVVVLGDMNDGKPPTAAGIAAKVGGHVFGWTVDKVIAVGVKVVRLRYVSAIPWLGKLLVLLSDHKNALLVDVEVKP